MSRVTTRRTVDSAGLAELLRPRDDVVAERALDDGSFEAVHGPVRHYRRTVTVVDTPDGRHDVTERIDFGLAVPVWGRLVTRPFRRALRQPRPDGRQPWWAPPDRLDARASEVLAVLCIAAVITGYLGTLLTQTITFAADEFEASRTAQSVALAATRVSIIPALVLVAAADRRGRRPLVVITAAVGCLAAATGALAPSLAWLSASQVVARGCSLALGLLVGILAAEEMPRNCRAYAISILAMAAALGAGMALWALPVADLGVTAWRAVYLVPLIGLGAVPFLRRRLPESRRFVAPHAPATLAGHGRRLWLLAVSSFLVQLFVSPAAQFQNEYLRDERGFSAARISLFTLATNTPGGIGIIVGGRLADLRGRRRVGAVGLVGGVAATVAMYFAAGWTLWAWSVIGAVVGAATVPALGVYGPELFPTGLRGRANGLIALVAVVGSVLGLVTVGLLADRLDVIGPALAVLAVAPVLTALLVLTIYPETAHRELEEINPEDRLAGGLSVE